MFRKLLFMCACFLSVIRVAAADENGSVMRQFGLVGTWSIDCSKDLKKEFGSRVTYSAPMFGEPTWSMTAHNSAETLVAEGKVRSAILVTEDKIKVVVVPLKSSSAARVGTSPNIGIFEKVGNKIRPIDSRTEDGKVVNIDDGRIMMPDGNGGFMSVADAPPLERCLN